MAVDEYLDLVDENDHVIGLQQRSEIYAQQLVNYRVVNAFILNSKGELLSPRRTKKKKHYPLALDFSVGGHVESGEDYEIALIREADEELNLDLQLSNFSCLGHLSPYKDSVPSFMKVYEIRSDIVPSYNPGDFVECLLMKPQELCNRIAHGDAAKSDLIPVLKQFYLF